MTCSICFGDISKPCKYCTTVSVCSKCYNRTHKHSQRHKYNVLKKEHSYQEELPEPT